MHSIRVKFLFIVFVLISVLFGSKIKAQELKKEVEDDKGSHKITVGLGHVYPKSEEEASVKSDVLSAYALNYDYYLTSHWSVGSHNELLLEDISEKGLNKEEEILHEKAVATTLVLGYKAGKHTSLMLGIGDEIVHSENILLSTVGVDYGWNLHKGWELGAEVTYDIKWHDSNYWTMGVGISKLLTVHHKK